MNKAQLIKAVSDELGIPVAEAEAAVNTTLATIMGTVSGGEKVSLTGFGVFTKTERAPRAARNPRTNEPIQVPAKTIVKFTPGVAFKQVTAL